MSGVRATFYAAGRKSQMIGEAWRAAGAHVSPAAGGLLDDGRPAIVYGGLRGGDDVILGCEATGRAWIYIDNGLLNPLAIGDRYFHHAWRARRWDEREAVPLDVVGYTRHAAASCHPRVGYWRACAERIARSAARSPPPPEDAPIVVALQTPHWYRYLGTSLERWSKRIEGELSGCGRPVLWRAKPSPGDNLPTLREQLLSACAVVTASSTAALEAAIKHRLPIYTEAAHPWMRGTITPPRAGDILRHPRPSVEALGAWVAGLAAHEFTLDDIRRGLAWAVLSRQRQQRAAA